MYVLKCKRRSVFLRSIDYEGLCHTNKLSDSIKFDSFNIASIFAACLNELLDFEDPYYIVFEFKE